MTGVWVGSAHVREVEKFFRRYPHLKKVTGVNLGDARAWVRGRSDAPRTGIGRGEVRMVRFLFPIKHHIQ